MTDKKADPGGPNPHGNVLGPRSLIMRQFVGTATHPDGAQYELATSMGGVPLIKNSTTGKTFAFNWQDLVDQARKEGIDTP